MKKILIATAVLMLPLAGCGSVTTETTGDVITNGSVENQQLEVQNEVVADINADVLLDQQLFGDASNGVDLSKCDAIVNEGMKKECAQVVTAGLLTTDAVEKKDKGVCDGIELERYKEECEFDVEEKIEVDKVKNNLLGVYDDAYAIEMNAIDKGNSALCDEIKVDSYRNRCIKNIDGIVDL